jgi:predicted transcriptional regulator
VSHELTEIRRIRKRLGLTQHQLATASGVSQSLIAKIESGVLDPGYRRTKRVFEALESFTKEEELSAGQIMNKKVVTSNVTDKLLTVIRTMKKKAISQVPVLENGKPVGLITESVVLDAIDSGKEINESFVKDVMEECPPIITSTTRIRVVAQLLHYFPIVLVVDKGVIKGLIAKADVIEKII